LEAATNSSVASSSSSSSSSSRATSAETQLFEDTWKAAVVVADRLAGILAFRIAADRPACMQHALPRLQDSTADKVMHSLLLYELAACAAALYAAAEQHNKQQGRPEPHHVQLLLQLGLGGLEFKADESMQKNRATYAMHHIKTASMEISSTLNNAAEGSNTGSSSSNRGGEGTVEVQPLPAAEAAARADCRNSSCSPLEAAAMLTLMQCTLLPPPGAEAAWFQHAVHLLGCFVNGLETSARVAAAAVMLQPFATQLLPAGLSALKAAAAAAAATRPASSSSAVPAASSSSRAAVGTVVKPQTSSAAVTALMPAQLCFGNAARVINTWLSTGNPCSISRSTVYQYCLDFLQHLLAISMFRCVTVPFTSSRQVNLNSC
jgi:hypothetical protein